jgi:hypothetical protein
VYFYGENTQGAHFKYYEMGLADDPAKARNPDGRYEVVTWHGRIGKSRVQHVYREKTYAAARAKFETLKRSKVSSRGYDDKSTSTTQFGERMPKFAAFGRKSSVLEKREAARGPITRTKVSDVDNRFAGIGDPVKSNERWASVMEEESDRFWGV